MEDTSITMSAIRAAADARIPCMLVGEPGVGKTEKMRAMAREMGYELITLLGSQMDPTDVTGLPKGEKIELDDGNSIWGTVYLAPWWQVKIMTKKKVMLFFDEFSNTSSSVRASLLTLLQNREFPNGERMPDETIVLGAMNPTDQAADGWELDRPTTNRMMFLEWKSPVQEWYDGMLKAWGKSVSEEEEYWRTQIVRFLNDNPSYLSTMNANTQNGTPEALGVDLNNPSAAEVLRYAWASRRSWDNLSRVLAKTERSNVLLQDEIASGLVGRKASIQFRNWILENSTVDPKGVLRNPKSVDWKSMSISDYNILFRALVEMTDEKNWRQIVAVLNAVADADRASSVAPFIASFLRAIINKAKMVSKEDTAEARAASVELAQRFRPNNSAE